jgi:cephalosporin hydroxylase
MTRTRVAAAAIVILAVLNVAQFLASRRAASGPLPDEAIQRFVNHWYVAQDFFMANHWLGVQTLQNPLDAWVTQEIITEVRPDVIVEAGTYKGGSAIMWAAILEQLNPNGKVITIDVNDETENAKKHRMWNRRVEFLQGSSTAPAIVEKVRQRTEGKRVLVILDSLHTRDHVYDELRTYAKMVPVGSYIVVQDTGAWKPEVSELSGAAQAITDFLAETDDFEMDRSRERFLLTNNPTGFLKRVK